MPLTIYKSSAGSGKTFTLVKEYLKIVLQNPEEYRHILAITFTNKATEEMKTRVMEELQGIAAQENEQDGGAMYKVIKSEFEEKGVQVDIVQNARITRRNLLHNYARFEISTIDSFFTRIIRSCARELNLPPRYTIDIDQAKALDTSVEMLYDDLRKNSDLLTWLEQFTQDRLSDSRTWYIDHAIKEMGNELFKERFYEMNKDGIITIEELKELSTLIKKDNQKFDKKMKDLADQAIQLIKRYDLVEKDLKAHTFSYFSKKIPNKEYTPSKTVQAIIDGEGQWYTKTSKNRSTIEEITPSLNALLQKANTLLETHHKGYLTNKEVLKNIYSYGVLSALAAQLKKYRDENNLLLISDTNVLIRQVIQDEDAPFLLEKVGSQYRHILIDEFQDTSDYQWYNLLPLVRNSLAEDHNVLIVGDVKQSIYRWRGGNMKLLLEQVQKDLFHHQEQTITQVLGSNFRTRTKIVEFNNAFFVLSKTLLAHSEDMPDPKLMELAYDKLEQNPEKEEGGYVKIQFFEDDSATKESSVQIMLNTLLADIDHCRESGFNLSDILILVRTNQHASQVAQFLADSNIAFITSNSLLLESSPMVRLLLSILEYLHSPFDALVRSKLLYQYCQYFDKTIPDLHLLFTDFRKHTNVRVHSGKEMNTVMTIAEKDVKDSVFNDIIPKELIEDLDQISRKPLVEIVEELVFLLDFNKEPNVYLQRFQDVCLECASQGTTDIASFAIWWKEHRKRTSILSSAGSNAVHIMTIHASKGLESPVVMLPFANYAFKPKGTIWANSQEEPYNKLGLFPVTSNKVLADSFFADSYNQEVGESLIDSLNLAYVSFTRPKERLFIYSKAVSKPKQIDKINNFNKLMMIILEHSDFPYRDHWSMNDLIFEYGALDKKSKDSEEEIEETQPLINYTNRPYSDKIQIRPESENYYKILNDDKAQLLKQGIKVHAVMERLEYREQLDPILDQFILDRRISEEDRPKIKEQVENLLNRDKFLQWFGEEWEILPEQSIFSNGETYRPDRVLIKDRQAVVIDYKKEVRNDSHVAQIRAYGHILQEMKKYDNIQLYLVYVATGVIDRVQISAVA